MDVMTVRGPIPASSLGVTLPHEHLLCDLFLVFQPHREFILADVETAASELRKFAAAGGQSLVDLTEPGMGRDPSGLRAISERSGVHVIMGTGRYREPFYEPEIWRRTTNDIADEFVRDLEIGVDEGIRAGIIGEIGVHGRHISPAEERVHRAAARAQMRTGVALCTHALASPIGLAQLDLFEEEGVDLRRVAIGHCDTYPRLDYHREILRRGAYVEFDTIRGKWEFETRRQVTQLVQLVDEGYLHQLLISQDICTDKDLSVFGGPGYAFVVTTFAEQLKQAGLSTEQIETLVIDNPRRLLTGEVARC